MRLEDYNFYGKRLQTFGIFFLLAGIALPILTLEIHHYRSLFGRTWSEWRFPFLNHGIVLAVAGLALVIIGRILLREYKFKMREMHPVPKPNALMQER